jgi:hypothetical protein
MTSNAPAKRVCDVHAAVVIDLAKSIRVEDEIARRGGLGLRRSGPELVGPCPQCGGRDRFAINVRKQIFLCRGCGVGGDVIDMVQHLDGCEFKTAILTLAGTTARKPAATIVKPPVSVNGTTAKALRLWDDASPITGTLAEEYLRRRGLEPPEDDEALRYYRGCPFGDSRFSCLLALYRDIHTNEPKAISRTALGQGGMKIGRKALGPVMGCAVKLDADENVTLGLHVGEGVETMLTARLRGLRPAWALGSAGAIKSFPALSGIESLTIVVDHDAPDKNGREAGQDSALACSERWTAEGREVRRIIPKAEGADMADLIKQKDGHGQ